MLTFFAVNAAQAAPAVEKVRVQTHPTFTRVVLETNAPIEPNLFTLGTPHRLVIDLPQMQWRIPRSSGIVQSRLVRKYSFGLFQPGVSRLVLDLAGPVKVVGRKLHRLPNRRTFLYQIDIAAAPMPASAPTAAPASQPQQVGFHLEDLPVATTINSATKEAFAGRSFDPENAEFEALSEIISSALTDIRPDEPINDTVETAALTPPKEVLKEKEPDLAPANRSDVPEAKPEDIEKAEPTRPSRPPLRIVLDPGHGGIDPGTGSGSGVEEKAINLAFAEALANLLREDPRYEVYLTRETDTRVKLPKRVAFARRKNADLFISIHADWSTNKFAKGATAYTLSEEASVEALETIATERDKVGRVAGVDLAAEREDVARLLVDLARRETQSRSLKFAELVIDEVAKDTPVLRRPLRRDSFHVLKAPDMPSVLLELGFVSNEEDRALLTSPLWRLKTASAVKRAIDAWRRATGSRDFTNR